MEQAFTYCSLRSGSFSKPTSGAAPLDHRERTQEESLMPAWNSSPALYQQGPWSRAQPPALGPPGLQHRAQRCCSSPRCLPLSASPLVQPEEDRNLLLS